MPPDGTTDEEKQEKLPEDGQTPFSPPDPARDPDTEADDERQTEEVLDPTHPDTDDGVQPEEVYDAGLESAAGASEPNAGNTVVGYTPPPADDDTDEDDEASDKDTPGGTTL